jgi:hypothetical protein
VKGRGRVSSWSTSVHHRASLRAAQKIGFQKDREDFVYITGPDSATSRWTTRQIHPGPFFVNSKGSKQVLTDGPDRPTDADRRNEERRFGKDRRKPD